MTLPAIDKLEAVPGEVLHALRARCAEAQYDDDLIMRMAALVPEVGGPDYLPVLQYVLRHRDDSAAKLGRLFAYADTLDAQESTQVLGESLIDSLLQAHLLARQSDGGIRSNFHLRPFDGLWLVADDPAGGSDAVMPPAGTTRQIAQVLPEHVTMSTLDIGCGPGSLALVAARLGAPTVVGTDVNARAIGMARFNARLNDLAGRCEFHVGDLTAPVSGRRFALVLAQPPYVILPPESQAVTYLHGGHTGEEIALRLIREVPDVLEPGGRALVLMEGAVRPDEPLHARIKPVLGDAPVDLLVLAAPGPTPVVQVMGYASLEAPEGGPAYRAAVQRYFDHLESIDAREFHHALVLIRAHPEDSDAVRRGRPRSTRAANSRGAGALPRLAATVPVRALSGGDATALQNLLASIDVAALGEEHLLHQAIRTAPSTRWVEERPRPDPTAQPQRSVHFTWNSFGSDVVLSEERFVLAAMLDQAPTIGDAICEYTSATDVPADTARAKVLAFVREGLMRGLFQPAALARSGVERKPAAD